MIGGEASAAVAEISGGVCHVDCRLSRRDTFDYRVTEDQLRKAFLHDGKILLYMSDWGEDFLYMSDRGEERSRTIFNARLSPQGVSSDGMRLKGMRLRTLVGMLQVLDNKGLQLQVVQLKECLVLSRVMYACLSAFAWSCLLQYKAVSESKVCLSDLQSLNSTVFLAVLLLTYFLLLFIIILSLLQMIIILLHCHRCDMEVPAYQPHQ